MLLATTPNFFIFAVDEDGSEVYRRKVSIGFIDSEFVFCHSPSPLANNSYFQIFRWNRPFGKSVFMVKSFSNLERRYAEFIWQERVKIGFVSRQSGRNPINIYETSSCAVDYSGISKVHRAPPLWEVKTIHFYC